MHEFVSAAVFSLILLAEWKNWNFFLQCVRICFIKDAFFWKVMKTVNKKSVWLVFSIFFVWSFYNVDNFRTKWFISTFVHWLLALKGNKFNSADSFEKKNKFLSNFCKKRYFFICQDLEYNLWTSSLIENTSLVTM